MGISYSRTAPRSVHSTCCHANPYVKHKSCFKAYIWKYLLLSNISQTLFNLVCTVIVRLLGISQRCTNYTHKKSKNNACIFAFHMLQWKNGTKFCPVRRVSWSGTSANNDRGVLMEDRPGVRRLPKGYSSYHGRFHNKEVGGSINFFADTRVAMDSVSAGHVALGKAASSFEEERRLLRESAKFTK